jgi:hypothetical protein
MTAVVATRDIDTWLGEIEEVFELSDSSRNDVCVHVRLRLALRAGIQADDPEVRQRSAALGLWLALNNPSGAEQMRGAVSDALRSRGRAQIVVGSTARGIWGFATSERPFELGSTIPDLPAGLALKLSWESEPDKPELN